MESNVEPIGDDDVLLRRVPPTSDAFRTIVDRPDDGCRTTSAVMSARDDEDHLSCSLRRITSPCRLIEDLRHDGVDPEGWRVCWFLASDARSLDLEVVHTPTDRDPGHCSVTATGGLAFPNNKAQKLARRTRILADHDLDDEVHRGSPR